VESSEVSIMSVKICVHISMKLVFIFLDEGTIIIRKNNWDERMFLIYKCYLNESLVHVFYMMREHMVP
jgi:hypothetical protein